MPLVSVIVPAWNSEGTLRETLKSVAEQTYRNIEILIVEDGSTDSTGEVADAFCQTEPRARVIRKANGGLSSARNRGIAEAKGEWVAPIDADDLWHPTKIEKQMAVALSAGEPIGFIYCWYRIIDEQGRVTSSGPQPRLSGQVFNQLAYNNVVENGSALLLSREALLSIGCYDESLPAYEDVMLQLRVARAYSIDVVPEYLVAWRRHSSNMSSDVDLIARSARRVYAQLISEGERPLKRADRWIAAQNAFFAAEQQAVRGSLLPAMVHLSRSLLLDPLRSTLLLTYRSVRSTRRRLRTTMPAPPPLSFSEIDPRLPLAGDPYELKSFSRLIEQVDRKRLAKLKATEPLAARRSTSTTV